MNKPVEQKTLLAVLGAGFAVTLAASPLVAATENPFAAVSFASSTQVAAEQPCGVDAAAGCSAQRDDDEADDEDDKDDDKED